MACNIIAIMPCVRVRCLSCEAYSISSVIGTIKTMKTSTALRLLLISKCIQGFHYVKLVRFPRLRLSRAAAFCSAFNLLLVY